VKFVGFTLPTQEKPLEGKARIEEMQKLADKAGEFAIAMTEKDATLEKVAEKFMVQVQTTPEFSQEEPPKELGASDQVAQAAFRLTKEEPNSDALSAENGYYVLQLAEVIPSRPLTFEEAKTKLEGELKDERAREALTLKATEVRNKIFEELKAGKSFADAAKAAGATPEAFPAFSMAEPKMDQPDAREVMSTAMDLKVGEISPALPTATGSLLVYLDKKLPLDDSKFESEKQTISQNIARGHREGLFREWMKDRREEANILVPRRGRA
jgi:parvulin-like peptidyl-prolyl isomerase